MSLTLSAGRGVTQVVERCEAAKESGFLDLSSCQLMFIADAVYLLIKGYEVDKISIRNNMVKKFPRKFATKFPTATVFNMEGNDITEFPSEMASWTSLKGINAANNGIEVFPEAFYSLQKLIFLDLSGNKIKELDVDRLYSNLPSLSQLNLGGNTLTEEVRLKLESHPKKPSKLTLKF